MLIRESFLPELECDWLVRSVDDLLSPAAQGKSFASNDGRRFEVPVHSFLGRLPGSAERILAIRSRCLSEVKDWRKDDQLHFDFSLLTVNLPGDSHDRHADNETRGPGGNEWVPNHTHWRTSTALIYLNTCDVDFEGGEIYFPRKNVAVKPRKGLMLAFDCGSEWEHQVLPVIRGRRRALAMWFTPDPSREERLSVAT